jgi:hypothetical protein
MLELAKKDFQNVRQDGDDNEPQPKVVRRGRPPGKNLKKSLGTSPFENVCPEPSSDPALASAGGNAGQPYAYNRNTRTGAWWESILAAIHNAR